MAAACVSEESTGGASSQTMKLDLRGDGLDDLRRGVRHGRTMFSDDEMLRALGRLDEVETRLRAVTRPEAVGYREYRGVAHVVLRCRACQSEFTGGSQTEWLAPPPAFNE